MVGITSYGAYVPYNRMSRTSLSEMWGGVSGRGERSVAYFDEDAVTMNVAAAMDCIEERNSKEIDGLYVASTTPPYMEKQCASIIAAALGLRKDVSTQDFSGSLRCGTGALHAAMNAVIAGSATNALVCASDVRLGFPKGENERIIGDGAGALLVGTENVIASIEAYHTVFDDVVDTWRSDRDRFVRTWEARFVRDCGYGRVVLEAISGALEKYGLRPESFSKVVLPAQNQKLANSIAKKAGFNVEKQVQPLIDTSVGHTGSALASMLLTMALDEANSGDTILLANYGDGCDIFVLKVTEKIADFKRGRTLNDQLKSKRMISYDKYIRWRELMTIDPPARPPADQTRPSAVALWRDQGFGHSLCGVKCKNCGTPQYPPQRVCYSCREKDRFDVYRFADKKAKITSFSHDMLSASLDPPTTVCAVDFIGGGRIMCDMTDRDPEAIQVDMPVEMTFRRLFYGAGFYTYWWKCRPVR